jgi:hypothetical protein
MAKAKSKPSSKRKVSSRRAASQTVPASRRSSSGVAEQSSAIRADTKHAKILDLLRSPAGTTVATMIKATGWQQHSVRGFLAAVVRKRLKLNLTSTPNEAGRIYRIISTTSSAGKSRAAKPAA